MSLAGGGSVSRGDDKVCVARHRDYSVYLDVISPEDDEEDPWLQDGIVAVYNRDGDQVGTMEVRIDANRRGKIVAVGVSDRFMKTDACQAALDLLVQT